MEIMGFIAREMGAAAVVVRGLPDTFSKRSARAFADTRCPLRFWPRAVLRRRCRSTVVSPVESRPDLVHSTINGLFASGTLGRYLRYCHSVIKAG